MEDGTLMRINAWRAAGTLALAVALLGADWTRAIPADRPLGVAGGGAVATSDLPAPGSLGSASARPALPRVAASSVIVENLDTGAILFARRPDQRRPIASLTKIMTAMIVLQATAPADAVTMTTLAASQRPTALGLPAGQRMDVHDLLYALLLHSSNDVAVALAQHISGSVAAFDDRMTRQGVAIGLRATRFASPSGLNDSGYSTARDVATLTRWAYRSPAFASIVATRWYSIRMPSGKSVRLRNLNDLLFDYRGAIGAKTGFTLRSGWSLAGAASRGGVRLLVVLLGDPNLPFRDGAAVLNWAFRTVG